MSRRTRQEILYDGCFAHILSRSFEKRWIFEGDGDFNTFKSLLLRLKAKHGFFALFLT